MIFFTKQNALIALLILLTSCTQQDVFNDVVEENNKVTIMISSYSDDAEECLPSSSVADIYSSDLEMFFDDFFVCNQIIGLRYTGVAIPPGANIVQSNIQFTASIPGDVDSSFIFRGEKTAYSDPFSETDGSISNRETTQEKITWSNVPAWTEADESNENQLSPDISAIIQEIINHPDWASGNSLGIIITGTGNRTAFTFNGNPDKAPSLFIEWNN